MSNYWDAVSRVARGSSGSAEPRPRSMFEAEALFDAAGDLDAVEQDTKSPPEPTPAPVVRGQPAPTSAAPAAITTSEAERTEAACGPSVLVARSSDPAEARPALQPRAAESDQSADTREPTTSPVPLEFGTRVEVHRIESQQTTLQLVESRPPQIEPDDTASAPPATTPVILAQPPVHQASPTEPSPVAVEPSTIVVAEPVVVPPPDRLVPTPEPPLVIEIGRIDIRIESETPRPPAAPRRRDTQPAQSLDDFLRRRGAGP